MEREHVATTHSSGGARREQTIDAHRSNPGALRARDANAMRSAAALSSARSSGVAVVPSSRKPSASQAAMALVVVMQLTLGGLVCAWPIVGDYCSPVARSDSHSSSSESITTNEQFYATKPGGGGKA